MAINKGNKQVIIARLARASGQLIAVQKMVQDELYCIDVLNQMKAVQGALDKTAQLMLKQHLNTCVIDAVKDNDSQRVMDELWQLIKRDHPNEASLEAIASVKRHKNVASAFLLAHRPSSQV